MYYVVTGTLRPLEPLGCLHRFSHELNVPLPVPTMLQSFAMYCFKRSIIQSITIYRCISYAGTIDLAREVQAYITVQTNGITT